MSAKEFAKAQALKVLKQMDREALEDLLQKKVA